MFPHVQCALLANAAGIGGGPFYVPLFNSVMVGRVARTLYGP
jgi:uncharacterized membrane protein SpoIIM required for sporulation